MTDIKLSYQDFDTTSPKVSKVKLVISRRTLTMFIANDKTLGFKQVYKSGHLAYVL